MKPRRRHTGLTGTADTSFFFVFGSFVPPPPGIEDSYHGYATDMDFA